MKKIILTFLFLFIGFVAFAQTPEEKADFLTEEMTSLLSLTDGQKAMVKITNRVYYRQNQKLIDKRDTNPIYQASLAGTLSPEREQAMQNKIAAVREARANTHKEEMKLNLTADQYTIYLQNIDRLFSLVTSEFGE